jgi:glycosyltransferase involved in cell wall biosynthesis
MRTHLTAPIIDISAEEMSSPIAKTATWELSVLNAAKTATAKGIIHVPRRYVADQWGGTETVIQEISLQQKRAGFSPLVMTSMALAESRNENISGVQVKRFNYCYPFFGLNAEAKAAMDKKGGNLLSLSLFVGLITAPDVRLFHSHAVNRLGGMVRTAARLRGKPFVVSVHGGVFDVPKSERSSMLAPIIGKIEWGRLFGAFFGSRRVLEDADMLVFVCKEEAEQARIKLSHDRIAHLPNGVDCSRFQTGDGASFRAKHDLPADAFVVLNISRIDEQKNQLLLLESFAQLAAERPDAHLVLIGPETQPDYAVRLRKFVEKSGLTDRVRILHGLKNNDAELVNAYHACDVFVLPSVHEPFGIVVLEAWSSGKAVIASNVGGLGTLIQDGENGIHIDPKSKRVAEDLTSKMLLLAQAPSKRNALAQAGKKEAITHYDWSRIAARQEEIYQQAEANAAQRKGEKRP